MQSLPEPPVEAADLQAGLPGRHRRIAEVIITNPSNWLSGDSTVVKVLHWKYIRDRVVLQETYAGSYNYAETISVGFSAHEKADVNTHREWPGFYLNPDPDSARRTAVPRTRPPWRPPRRSDRVHQQPGGFGVGAEKAHTQELAASHLPPVNPETL